MSEIHKTSKKILYLAYNKNFFLTLFLITTYKAGMFIPHPVCEKHIQEPVSKLLIFGSHETQADSDLIPVLVLLAVFCHFYAAPMPCWEVSHNT
jgi:hypothetical protein